jgi:hypothetical protein
MKGAEGEKLQLTSYCSKHVPVCVRSKCLVDPILNTTIRNRNYPITLKLLKFKKQDTDMKTDTTLILILQCATHTG